MTGKDLSEKSVKKSDTPLLFKGHRVAVNINTINYMLCATRIMENRLTKQINADWFRRYAPQPAGYLSRWAKENNYE